MPVVETIDRLSDLALSKNFQRKVESCFLLVSKIVPFYSQYALLRAKAYPLRDHVLFLWSQHCVGSTVTAEDALHLEQHIPDGDDARGHEGNLIGNAQNAMICALHLTWYLARRDDSYVKGCVVNYFDHIDYLAQERMGLASGVPALTDLLVARSRLFQSETDDFESALLRDERENLVNRTVLIANMERDISDYL